MTSKNAPTVFLAALLAATAQAEPASSSTTTATAALDSVIVTGTRTTGTKVSESVSPISIVSADDLMQTGQRNVIDALARLEPSFVARALGGDYANIVRSATLRGQGPNQTLVLVNGKRRHTTAFISTSGGLTSGAAAVDLDQIPVSAIERIEVLRDGAAAQYGSDAIAGVINIILKNSQTEGTLDVSYGQFHKSDINPNGLGNGRTRSVSASKGFRLDGDGFLDISAEWRDKLHTNQTGPELRTTTIDKYASRIIGDAAYDLGALGFNAGKTLANGIEAYAFGTFATRRADSYQNQRLPNNPAFATLVAAGIYTQGFEPRETTSEQDRSITAGVRGRFAGDGRWDASLTTGGDRIDLGVDNTINVDLFNDTGSSPTRASIGRFSNRQTTANLDFSKPFDVGLARPLQLAGGLEARQEQYGIGAGDFASHYEGGTQAFVGLTEHDAGTHDRNVFGAYFDAELRPAQGLQLGAALRTEHYNDFGDTTTGKLSARWDASPAFALRGTVSTGYRAPNLAEQYFSSTLVTPVFTYVQLPANSAAAKLAGAQNLKPEKSDNISLGLVAHPAKDVELTADAYQIRIKDRIVLKTGISGAPAAAAIAAAGIVAQPGTSAFYANYFANGIDTTSRGLDLSAQTRSDFGAAGFVKWSLAGNFQHLKIDKADPSFSLGVLSPLTDSTPKHKLVATADYTLRDFTGTLRVTHYGRTSQWTQDGLTGGAPWHEEVVKPAFIVDLEVGYEFSDGLRLAVGANNIANKRPEQVPLATALPTGGQLYPAFSPYGINGAFYYANASWRF
ncbi:TonB-dependent receptor [Paucibacter sp. R3-3]|uniref:TonB-dependent receptor n=1 Tax=Roseateles agri TaxID=3098619 RepID=A0ABU5DKC3_9BURK|nr:TonB-dependent receptor [Paucibacter sp. R3-3]MDY0746753.1 TonB-dependent receptor [Paucibacter sp. R3-3]